MDDTRSILDPSVATRFVCVEDGSTSCVRPPLLSVTTNVYLFSTLTPIHETSLQEYLLNRKSRSKGLLRLSYLGNVGRSFLVTSKGRKVWTFGRSTTSESVL